MNGKLLSLAALVVEVGVVDVELLEGSVEPEGDVLSFDGAVPCCGLAPSLEGAVSLFGVDAVLGAVCVLGAGVAVVVLVVVGGTTCVVVVVVFV